jgi:EAL domain-containing protein (putative c-di-GMP-specific phosphodiesterase class I)
MKVQIEDRKLLETQLRQAITDHAFELHYQPRLQLSDFKLAGFEALLRWRHPLDGLLSPAIFLSVAEESGLIVPIGDLVVRLALWQARTWTDAGFDFGRIAINMAAGQFKRGAIVDLIEGGLADHRLPASCLEIEVTEDLLVGRSTDIVAETLRRMHRMGLSISLDDFGTGFASLSHLKAFPVDSLKIDQSFVRDIETDSDDAAIVRTVINLGQSLGKNVIAEGIETEAQLEFLKRHGCQQGQGYLFAPPLPPDEALAKAHALQEQYGT